MIFIKAKFIKDSLNRSDRYEWRTYSIQPTAALDTESEHLIQQALSRLMKNRTSIVIAHRLSTIHDADQIIVLEKGQVLEKGTHDQLMQNNGRYKQLHDLQFPQLNDIKYLAT